MAEDQKMRDETHLEDLGKVVGEHVGKVTDELAAGRREQRKGHSKLLQGQTNLAHSVAAGRKEQHKGQAKLLKGQTNLAHDVLTVRQEQTKGRRELRSRARRTDDQGAEAQRLLVAVAENVEVLAVNQSDVVDVQIYAAVNRLNMGQIKNTYTNAKEKNPPKKGANKETLAMALTTLLCSFECTLTEVRTAVDDVKKGATKDLSALVKGKRSSRATIISGRR